MRVRRVEIERFRGIRSLDWRFIGDTACLVGPGDTGKSTILDALERVLSPRWNYPFDDGDFYDLETYAPVSIRATVVDFPPSFFKESKFGLALQAYDPKAGTATTPTGVDDEVFAVVIELTVDRSLEPQWRIIDAKGEGHPIHIRDREALGMLRVGSNIDLHLGWNRGSVLTRVTESGDEVAAVIADAMRKARAGLAVGDLDRLNDAASKAEQLGKDMGALIRTGLTPHLDIGPLSGGSLSLHDGKVPLRRAGLGTRRLMAVAMQHHAAGSSELTLVDEFEHGLEPHRIRQLLRKLRGVSPENADKKTGQLVLTTHTPLVLSELHPAEIAVVRRAANGVVVVVPVSDALHRVVSKTPGALVARRVIVAEGPTEVGLLRAVEEAWSDDGSNFAYLGTAVVNGEGHCAPDIAGALFDLGSSVALFVDSDAAGTKLSRAKGAKVIAWRKGLATENALASDLSDQAFTAMVALAHRSPKVRHPAHRSMRDALAAATGKKPSEVGDDLTAWLTNVPNFRLVFGAVAKKNKWFKTLALGRDLGALVVEDWDNLAGTDVRSVLEALRVFAQRG